MTKIPDWTSFLRTWSDERIAVRDLDDESVRHGWLGCEPATQDEIAAVETRLGLRLPRRTGGSWRPATGGAGRGSS